MKRNLLRTERNLRTALNDRGHVCDNYEPHLKRQTMRLRRLNDRAIVMNALDELLDDRYEDAKEADRQSYEDYCAVTFGYDDFDPPSFVDDVIEEDDFEDDYVDSYGDW